MKVLHLISGGDTGGAKTHIISLLKGLNKSIETKIICFIKGNFYEEALEANIKIEVYEQKSRSDLSIVARLAEEIQTNEYDVVHCHGARANFVAMFLKGKIRIPIITTIHSDYRLDFKDNFYKKILYTALNSFALNRFDYYIAISDFLKKMLVERGYKKDRVFVAYNGIDIDKKYQYDRQEFFRKHNIEDRYSSIVGIVARLDKVKNHETFIIAADKVINKREDILFLIAGIGNREKHLKELVENLGLKENVKFLGHLKDTYSFYNIIDINTLTSLSESFPYVILEGAIMKTPIISTDVGGINKLVKNGHNGYLFDAKDIKFLSSKILELADDKDKLLTLGQNLYDDVVRNYSYDSMAARHLDIYNEIIKGYGHGLY